ncbi:MAG TPA: aspartate 4-decarboxylase, partial [Nitrospiria bacterium]|nr:aspartate 4-decarboxylase [Nitrospiria bacterium]
MATKTSKPSTSRAEQRKLLTLSPFELKDKLISLAAETERESQVQLLNAGRGNPNWICTTPREAFGTLLQFGIGDSRRGLDIIPDAGRMPQKHGIANRFKTFLDAHKDAPGAKLLGASFEYGTKTLGFDPDTFAHELTEGIIGCMYPVPDRMLRCTERIVHDFLAQELCAGKPPAGRFDLFAVEGGTAAMCYIFDSLMLNHLLRRGDTIALGVPTFTPYIEIPHFDRYAFKVVNIDAGVELRPDGTHTWQYADKEIDKL